MPWSSSDVVKRVVEAPTGREAVRLRALCGSEEPMLVTLRDQVCFRLNTGHRGIRVVSTLDPKAVATHGSVSTYRGWASRGAVAVSNQYPAFRRTARQRLD